MFFFVIAKRRPTFCTQSTYPCLKLPLTLLIEPPSSCSRAFYTNDNQLVARPNRRHESSTLTLKEVLGTTTFEISHDPIVFNALSERLIRPICVSLDKGGHLLTLFRHRLPAFFSNPSRLSAYIGLYLQKIRIC